MHHGKPCSFVWRSKCKYRVCHFCSDHQLFSLISRRIRRFSRGFHLLSTIWHCGHRKNHIRPWSGRFSTEKSGSPKWGYAFDPKLLSHKIHVSSPISMRFFAFGCSESRKSSIETLLSRFFALFSLFWMSLLPHTKRKQTFSHLFNSVFHRFSRGFRC